MDLRKYRKATAVAKDLETILKIYSLASAGLQQYARYIPVAETFAVMQKNKVILELYLDKCNQVIETKGKINE